MDTIEFVFKIENTTPVRITKMNGQPAETQAKGLSYWALSADAYGPYPPVLMHIYCPGPLPPEDRRDELNAVAKAYTGELLTSQRDSQHLPDGCEKR